MSAAARPRIAILGRMHPATDLFPISTLVIPRLLAEAIWNAGGEPLTLLPTQDTDWSARLAGCQGVLMPGGADINPALYGQTTTSDEVYGIDDLQDAADLSLTRWALDAGVPFLAICRGFQMVNVATGGTLVQHMVPDHRDVMQEILIESDIDRLGLSSDRLLSSCYHHQSVDKLGEGLRVIATSELGHPEAFAIDNGHWAYGVQWHPEHTAHADGHQAEIFTRFVSEAAAAKPI